MMNNVGDSSKNVSAGKKKKFPSEIVLLLCAVIWGFGFIAQRLGNQHIGPFTFISIRFFMGALTVLPILFIVSRGEKQGAERTGQALDKQKMRLGWLRGSLVIGLILFAGSSFQQVGLINTDAGKAGFITALYIVLVPILGLFLGKKVGWHVWIALIIAVTGLYLLTVKTGMRIETSDFIVLLGAIVWSFHILSVDHFTQSVNAFRLAFGQFLVCALVAGVVALIREPISLSAIGDAIKPLLFSGVVVGGFAFTFQVIGQKDTDPTIASLLMSLEAVFAVIGGVLFLNERMTGKEWLGCALMLIAVILTQLRINPLKFHPIRIKKRQNDKLR